MSSFFDDAVASFNKVLSDSINLMFLMRDTDLQREARERLGRLDREAEVIKKTLVEAGDAEGANVMLAFQCAADSLAEELSMWLALKDSDSEQAWSHLISAQEAASAVARANGGSDEIQRRVERLMLLEKLLFPPQIYMSIGSVVRGAECSICGADYEDCSHIAGQPYDGHFCAMIPRKIEPDHVALVNEPADKRCRVVFFSDRGKKRNRMTWKLGNEDLEDRIVQGILMAPTGRWARMTFTSEMFREPAENILDKPLTSSVG